jgi:hypothetical protein
MIGPYLSNTVEGRIVAYSRRFPLEITLLP